MIKKWNAVCSWMLTLFLLGHMLTMSIPVLTGGQDYSDCQIRQIYANGNKAGALYKKYQQPLTEREILVLPSTSPANAAWSLDRLYEKWSEILR